MTCTTVNREAKQTNGRKKEEEMKGQGASCALINFHNRPYICFFFA